jgi:hypothetical protein
MKKMNKKGQFDIAGILSNMWFWIILGVMAITGVGMRWMRKVNLNKRRLLVISVLGILFASGIVSLAMLGIGSVSGSGTGVHIDRISTTTAYTYNNGTAYTDAGEDDTVQSDFYVPDGAVVDGNITTGIWAVYRSNAEKAATCKVEVIKPADFTISNTEYSLIVEDAQSEIMSAWVNAASTSGAASHTHPKESSMLPFAEGVALGYASVKIEIDSTAFDALSQYDEKAVDVLICDYPYRFVMHNIG